MIAGGLTQYGTVRSGGSYLSSSDLRLHFGLGSASKIDRLEMRWPSPLSPSAVSKPIELGSPDQVEVLTNLPVDRLLVVKEGEGMVSSKPFARTK